MGLQNKDDDNNRDPSSGKGGTAIKSVERGKLEKLDIEEYEGTDHIKRQKKAGDKYSKTSGEEQEQSYGVGHNDIILGKGDLNSMPIEDDRTNKINNLRKHTRPKEKDIQQSNIAKKQNQTTNLSDLSDNFSLKESEDKMSNKEIGEQRMRQMGLYGTPTGSTKNTKTKKNTTQHMPVLSQNGNNFKKPSSWAK